MKNLLISLSAVLAITSSAVSQTVDCGTAVQQLHNYAAQVNQIYNYEYWQGIPVRCPAFDGYGRPFHPQLVQDCRNQMLYSLNQWYAQQSYFINNTYNQIAQGCSTSSRQRRMPVPDPDDFDGTDQVDDIDVDEIDDLTLGMDEDKAIRIKIPNTAAGFKPR
jgi:hypothetical protein